MRGEGETEGRGEGEGWRGEGESECIMWHGYRPRVDWLEVLNFSRAQGKRERENSNSKTLFYKDCSLGSVKNLSNN